MRQIGTLEDQTLAERLAEFLRCRGIENVVERDDTGHWALWVRAEEDLAPARSLLAQFRLSPDDPLFRLGGRANRTPATEPSVPRTETTGGPGGAAARPPTRPRARAVDERMVAVGPGWGWVTLGVVMLCVAVAALTGVSRLDRELVQRLFIAEVPFHWRAPWAQFLPEVRSGEVWRLLTPALLHFGWSHIIFNLWAFWDLGNLIERARGSWTLIVLVVVLALVSNLGQYLVSGPRFGGLSGVVYGLLGYVWMMGKFRPEAGMMLHPQSVVLMLVWFVICISGALGIPVANTAHGVGLGLGMAWGFGVARWGR